METQEHLIRARELDPPADAWRTKRPRKPMRLEVIAGLGLGLIAGYEWGIVYGIICCGIGLSAESFLLLE